MTQKLQNHLQNGYDFRLGDYISRGMDIFKVNAGGFIGYTLLYLVIAVIINFIPFISIIISALISPCLVFGFFLAANKASKGIVAEFNEFFKGFDYFGKLVVISLITGLIFVVIFLPLIFTVGISAFSFKDDPQAMAAAIMGNIGLALICGLIAVFISVCWIFASQIAVFHRMEAWQAMEASRKLVMKNWLMAFLFLLVLGIINIVGALPCGLGLLFTIPFTYCATHAAFLDIAGMPEDDNGAFLEN